MIVYFLSGILAYIFCIVFILWLVAEKEERKYVLRALAWPYWLCIALGMVIREMREKNQTKYEEPL